MSGGWCKLKAWLSGLRWWWAFGEGKMAHWIDSEYIDITNDKTQETIGRFKVTISPKGFRGIWLLGKALKKLPFITGNSPYFHIKVEKLGSKASEFSITLRREYIPILRDKDKWLIFTQENSNIYERDVKDNPIFPSGEYKYILSVGASVFDRELTILAFEAISREHIDINIILSAVVAVVVSGIVSLVLHLVW